MAKLLDDVLMIGVDEAGRGNCCGNMVVCAVASVGCLDPEVVERVNDSKKLSEQERRDVFEKLTNWKVGARYKAVSVTPAEIDRMGVWEAEQVAIEKAVAALVRSERDDGSSELLVHPASYVMVDGSLKPNLRKTWPANRVRCEPRADGKYLKVAAASVIAKTIKDDELLLDDQAPLYEFEKNKGYLTRRLYELILENGKPTSYRRRFQFPLRWGKK
jgi:ribonuclease HII